MVSICSKTSLFVQNGLDLSKITYKFINTNIMTIKMLLQLDLLLKTWSYSLTVTMAGHTFWSSLIFSVLLLSPGFILQKSGTSTVTFTHEHRTADIGAGGPGF